MKVSWLSWKLYLHLKCLSQIVETLIEKFCILLHRYTVHCSFFKNTSINLSKPTHWSIYFKIGTGKLIYEIIQKISNIFYWFFYIYFSISRNRTSINAFFDDCIENLVCCIVSTGGRDGYLATSEVEDKRKK